MTTESDAVIPEKLCDIVLKGGITSGVVYPLALVELSKRYRFANVGGTSAGAIAAAAAAAAEHGRSAGKGGFARVAQIPAEVGPNLLSLFQPTPRLAPLFKIFLALLKPASGGPWLAALAAAIRGYAAAAIAGAAPGLLIILAALAFANAGFAVTGLIVALLGAAAAIVYSLYTALKTDLVANDYGLCTGIRQPGVETDAFTDWLARVIDEAAGIDPGHDPLTFGNLSQPPNGQRPVKLAMITTSLMEQRPYTLPLQQERRFVFKRSEWERLFPAPLIAYLARVCDRFDPPGEESGEFYYFPAPDLLPVIVAVRMSLSFPGLISAVPLWRQDFSYADPVDQKKLRRCLFSDGGLSSNFPIHFFDSLLPSRPTFAISLDEFVEERKRPDRVWMPQSAQGGVHIPVEPFSGILGFVMRLVDSARNWQDRLQSILPGYRERIVHVGLKPSEGGLNLTMSPETIKQLTDYGQSAGKFLTTEFDLDAHRWKRFLVAMARVEDTLEEVTTAYDALPDGGNFGAFLEDYAPTANTYAQPADVRDMLLRHGHELAACGRRWRDEPHTGKANIPKPETNLRITPKP